MADLIVRTGERISRLVDVALFAALMLCVGSGGRTFASDETCALMVAGLGKNRSLAGAGGSVDWKAITDCSCALEKALNGESYCDPAPGQLPQRGLDHELRVRPKAKAWGEGEGDARLSNIDFPAWMRPALRDPVNRYITNVHRAYKELKSVTQGAKGVDYNRAKTALNSLRDSVHGLMKARGLREPFAAYLDTGLVLADSGNSDIRNARTTTAKSPAGFIEWESKHFRDEEGPVDFSFGGRFGVSPTLTLAIRSDEAPQGNNKADTLRALYSNAFHWDLSARVNKASGDGEFSLIVARFGQTLLMTETETIEQPAGDPLTTQLVRNGIGRSARFVELSTEYRLFDNPQEIVHDDKTYLNPVFSVAAGLRWDQRFQPNGDLEGFSQPTKRWFVRMFVNLNEVVDRRDESEEPKSFSVGFGVDYETARHAGALGRSTIPSGTKIYMNANFDVLSKLTRTKPEN